VILPWTAGPSRKAARRAKAAGDWLAAAGHYRRALHRDPGSAATWVQYGNALRECGRASEAETAYRKSLELADSDPDAHVQLAHLLKQQRRGDEAISEYLRALELDPLLLHASQELIDLGWTRHVKAPASRQLRPSIAGNRATGHAVVIDANDLLLHFLHARLPTGIQRVQLRIIRTLLNDPVRNWELVLACFVPCRDSWVGIPEHLFLTLTGLAAEGGRTDERSWQEAVSDLTSVLVHGDLIEFPVGAVLVNLGTSWPHANYFLRVRNAKARSGVRYVPFVHDCVPALMPGLCIDATVRNYTDWLLGVFFHADGFLANSNSTAIDLSNVAARLGHNIAPPQVIRLDGEFSTFGQPEHGQFSRLGDFVLLVSTFEPRKNHLLAFEVWLKLIEKRGLRRTPRLVCVGHRGWKADAAMSMLRSNRPLQRRVHILTAIADAHLAELYRRCLFTFYPSLYEGWGLPVTESLCHHKVPLIGAVSSLPEAGGEFAEYFDPNSPDDVVRKLERLIDFADYRANREALIRAKFRARPWGEIAGQVIDCAVTGLTGCGPSGDAWAPLPAEIGRYYPFSRGRESSIRVGMVAGEIYRIGEGWWAPEQWGCWLKENSADLVFSLSELSDHACFLYVGLRGLPARYANFRITVLGDEIVRGGTLKPDQNQWPTLQIQPKATGARIHVRITSDQNCNLAEVTGGIDRRVVTLGILGIFLSVEDGLIAPPHFGSQAG
jgi:glycosyltransferase involved in cell wall biosynthesis